MTRQLYQKESVYRNEQSSNGIKMGVISRPIVKRSTFVHKYHFWNDSMTTARWHRNQTFKLWSGSLFPNNYCLVQSTDSHHISYQLCALLFHISVNVLLKFKSVFTPSDVQCSKYALLKSWNCFHTKSAMVCK